MSSSSGSSGGGNGGSSKPPAGSGGRPLRLTPLLPAALALVVVLVQLNPRYPVSLVGLKSSGVSGHPAPTAVVLRQRLATRQPHAARQQQALPLRPQHRQQQEVGTSDSLPDGTLPRQQQRLLAATSEEEQQQQQAVLAPEADAGAEQMGDDDEVLADYSPPQFVRYEPSQWEQEWLGNASAIQADPLGVCGRMLRAVERSRKWVAAAGKGGTLQLEQVGDELELDADVFSRLTYRDPASGEEYAVWVEPLVGHYRHPYTPAACVPPGMPPLEIQDRGYLLLHGLGEGQFEQLYPGRRYLFDLGTASYDSSLGWFVEHYRSWGVEFDELWAWEVQNQPPGDYWAKVPSDILPRLHFYNVPVTTEPGHPNNPIQIIKRIYRLGDFVVLKLDIDNAELENQLIEQLQGDGEALRAVSEMFFEQHYDHSDMAMAFGHPNASWADVGRLFGEMRGRGLRLHYWP